MHNERGESNPDFDKIVPLCDYFSISTDELLRGENPYLEREIVFEKKKNKALMISLCVIIFVVMMVLILIFDEVGGNDTLSAISVMIGLGAIGIVLINYFYSKPLNENIIKTSQNLEKRKLINSIINMLILLIYFGISFIFQSWTYSWIIFLIGGLIKKLIALIIMLGGNNNEQ